MPDTTPSLSQGELLSSKATPEGEKKPKVVIKLVRHRAAQVRDFILAHESDIRALKGWKARHAFVQANFDFPMSVVTVSGICQDEWKDLKREQKPKVEPVAEPEPAGPVPRQEFDLAVGNLEHAIKRINALEAKVADYHEATEGFMTLVGKVQGQMGEMLARLKAEENIGRQNQDRHGALAERVKAIEGVYGIPVAPTPPPAPLPPPAPPAQPWR